MTSHFLHFYATKMQNEKEEPSFNGEKMPDQILQKGENETSFVHFPRHFIAGYNRTEWLN